MWNFPVGMSPVITQNGFLSRMRVIICPMSLAAKTNLRLNKISLLNIPGSSFSGTTPNSFMSFL